MFQIRNLCPPGRFRQYEHCMNVVIKEIDSHGPVIAGSEEWLNGGRYDRLNTAWGYRYWLYRDGTVYRQKVMYHKEQGFAALRRRKWETLDLMRAGYPEWKDFRDTWVAMQENRGRTGIGRKQIGKGEA